MKDGRNDPPDPAGEFPFVAPVYFLYLATLVVHHREDRLEKALRAQGRTLAEFRVLRVAEHTKDCTMGEISQFTMIDRTTLTRVVDRLVAKGLIARSESSGDRRKVILTVTNDGLAAYMVARKIVELEGLALMDGLSDQEIRGATRFLSRIVEKFARDQEQFERFLWTR
jgi:DNA-binding MarR family transcriptional regulator